MINIYILSIFGAMFLGMFTLGFQFTTVNRIFVSTPVELFEKSLHLDETSDHILYFDDELLNKNLSNYYYENLKYYVTDFEIEIDYYYNSNEFCFLDDCTKAKVNFKATLAFNLTYKKSMTYHIERTDNG